MKLYTENGFSFFWDTNLRLWTLYPVDENRNRIEQDEDGRPIEVEYFNNREQLKIYINQNRK